MKATFGSGDTGTVVVYGSAGAAQSAVSGGLPAQGSGDIPDIIRIGPAPGSPPAIAVTFARPLPSHAYLVIMLSGPGGEAALSDPVVRGNSATVTIDSSSPLKPGARCSWWATTNAVWVF